MKKAVCGICDADAEEIEEDEEEMDARKTVQMADPKKPSQEEMMEHEKTHLPYQNWCRHYVRGRGKEMPHKKAAKHQPCQKFIWASLSWAKRGIQVIRCQFW